MRSWRLGRRAIALGTAAALGMLVLPGSASAGTASITGSTLTYSAATGEINDLTVETDGSIFRVVDNGSPVTAGTGCNPRTTHRVNCPTTGITLIQVLAREGDDSVEMLTGTLDTDLNGGQGADTLIGAEGDDTLSAGRGDANGNQESLFAGAGDDILNGGTNPESNTFLNGGPNDDQLIGGPGTDSLFGDVGDDDVQGGDGFDFYSATGNSGATIRLDDVANDGEAGEIDNVHSDIELVFGTSFDDTLIGAVGDEVFQAGSGEDTVLGGPGDDTLMGDNDPDTLAGEAGIDVLQGGFDANPDDMSGGAGMDTADYSDHSVPITVTINNVANDGATGGAEGDNVRTDVENLRGGPGSDTLTGSTSDNHIEGRGGGDSVMGIGGDDRLFGDFTFPSGTFGTDTLNGGNGDDDLAGGDGGDDMIGGNDFDSVSYVNFAGSTPVTVNVGDNAANDGVAGENDNIRPGVEQIVGANGDDDITGSGGINTLIGGGGTDTLHGAGGADTLQGDRCCTSVPDVLDGGDGVDTVTYSYIFSPVTVDIDGVADDGTSGGTEGDNVMTTVENLIGTGGQDSLTGSSAANALLGRGGDDMLFGAAGPDSLAGGPQADTLEGEAGKDELNSRGDGTVDTDNCGTEADVAVADGFDTVNVDCETVIP